MTDGLAPGTLLGGRYRIVRLLAEGGMGVVYEGEHLDLGRRVAIKTLLSELQDQPRLIQRFIREARATCMISHPNVVSVLDIDQTPDGLVFFVMEYLEGEDVSQVLEREGAIAWDRARRIALQVCEALGAAHDRGVVHRDLKPSNCFLVRDENGDERVKVLDFGIAKVLESSAPRAGSRGPGTGRDLRWLRTSTGEVFGTLAYMAPEHLNGDLHDHHVDIYAIGVILHEMLTGAPPFSPDVPGTFIQQVLFEPPTPPSQLAPHAGIPPDLDYVVMRALEKRPNDRFASMDELAATLTSVRSEAAPAIPVPWIATPVLAPVAVKPVPAAPARPRAAPTRRSWVPGVAGLLGVGAVLVATVLAMLVMRTPPGTTQELATPPEAPA
ncbi:MAG TPA: serine/threonine-protein kinase, partial [Nannocystis sp.]